MTISYELAPNPKWYIADLVGLPLAGGTLFSYRSLNKNQFKPIFQDPGGNFPWTQPILFDENGSQGPFYFEVDTAMPLETYYLEVYDSSGVLQWTIDNFGPTGGGGGNITTALNLDNLITNNVFWRNIGATASPIATTQTLIAPGAHAAFGGNALPDIQFLKNNTAATDQITFINFPLGSNPLTGDITPVQYLNYNCTNTPAGETFKYIQLPITTQVQNLTNQNVVVTLWARLHAAGGATSLTLQWGQFFGDGAGASPQVNTPIQTVTLTTSWQKFVLFSTIPDVSGTVLGACGNSALYLLLSFPLGLACNIDLTKPCVFEGNFNPTSEYQTYDMIDGVINAPRTGSYLIGFLGSSVPPGYVGMNDGTIGSATSGATSRANIDTFPLYSLLWNNVNDTWAPVIGGRGASAINDFTANKALTLTRQLGRAISGNGNGAGLSAFDLGQFGGVEAQTLVQNNLPSTMNMNITNTPESFAAGGGSLNGIAGSSNIPITLTNAGGGQSFGIIQPTVYMNVYIKL